MCCDNSMMVQVCFFVVALSGAALLLIALFWPVSYHCILQKTFHITNIQYVLDFIF